MARLIRRALPWLLFLLLLAVAALYARDWARRHPQDLPWTELELRQPVGYFTMRKLVKLGGEPRLCRALLGTEGVGDEPVPARQSSPECGYNDGMRLGSRGRSANFAPGGLVTSCPVAAALLLLDREVLQLAAARHFGSKVVAVNHLGSFSCRRIYGRNEGPFSEHATADAVDISGFVLVDGTRISVLRDWSGNGPKADFLREVRDGSCKLFATVLSPDYNAAHADHLHLDLAERGLSGWSLCR